MGPFVAVGFILVATASASGAAVAAIDVLKSRQTNLLRTTFLVIAGAAAQARDLGDEAGTMGGGDEAGTVRGGAWRASSPRARWRTATRQRADFGPRSGEAPHAQWGGPPRARNVAARSGEAPHAPVTGYDTIACARFWSSLRCGPCAQFHHGAMLGHAARTSASVPSTSARCASCASRESRARQRCIGNFSPRCSARGKPARSISRALVELGARCLAAVAEGGDGAASAAAPTDGGDCRSRPARPV